MSQIRSIAIVGAGIGGLTLANTLLRSGLSVSVFERSSTFLPTAGAAFGLQPNGQIALEHIGLKKEIKDIIQPFENWRVIDDHGQLIHQSTRLKEYTERFGYPIGGALRSDLIDILKKPVEQAGRLFYSHPVKKIEQDADGVTVTFEHKNEEKTDRFDMLVGADGIHSTVVKEIFSQTAPAVHSKENIFYGIIEKSPDPIITMKNTLTQCFSNGEFISYPAGNRGDFMWAATYHADAPPTNDGDAEWTQMKTQQELNQFLKTFRSSHPIHQCAAATKQNRLLHFGLFFRQHRNDGWHRGRICLLGDSCHATLPYVGQGANMAIEDAIVLDRCLKKHQFQLESAFQEYYQTRFERTKRMVNMARYMGLVFHSENFLIRAIRQRMIPWLMDSDLMIKMAEKEMYDHCPIPIEQRKKSV